MLSFYSSRELHEDRISELKKHYKSPGNKAARKPLQWIKKVLKRDEA